MHLLKEIKLHLELITKECNKFYNKNSRRSGRRARVMLMQVSRLAKELRKDIINVQKDMDYLKNKSG